MRRHCVRGYDPRAAAQLVRNGKLVVMLVFLRVEAEGHQRKAVATRFRHDDEAHFFQGFREVISCAGEIGHDGAVAVLSKTDKLIILANYL